MQYRSICIAIFFATCCTWIQAASPSMPVRQEQLEQTRQEALIRSERRLAPQGVIGTAAVEHPSSTALPGGTSFYIRSIEVEHADKEFSFLAHRAQAGRQMDSTAIQQLVDELNTVLLEKGYATCRVLLREQNLQDGVLRLYLLAGRLRTVRYSEDSARVPWRSAFPIREGDILNLRLIEQGLEQMKRLSSQDVAVKLVPTQDPELTDIELTVKRTRPIHGLLSLDNSGLSDTGKVQWSASVSIDQPLYANDILSIGINGDGMRDGYLRGTRGHNLYYRIPHGNDTFSFFYSYYDYRQHVRQRPYSFISTGKTKRSGITWDHVLSRTRRQKTSMDVSLTKRHSHYYINDMEIPVQALHTTALEVGISRRLYTGKDTVYTRLGYRRGIGLFGAQAESKDTDAPKSRYHMWLIDAEYTHPFTMGHRPAVFSSSLHGQWTTGGDRLYGVDMISIGNRYTVRGFDGEYTLMGESGWYVQSEVSSYIPALHSSAYAGIDTGAVYGPSARMGTGRTLAGAVVGMRGDISPGFSYDVFAGTPLYKPQGHRTGRAFGFTLSRRW